MELRVLNYFLAIAREENFTKAANILHVTQPTLSRQIADLERELGVKLFNRSNHNIVLTEDGMILKRRAQEILSLADKTKRDFLQKDDALSGTISIGSGEFRSTEYLAKIIAEFRNKYPNVKYEIYSGNANNIRDYIERGLLDIKNHFVAFYLACLNNIFIIARQILLLFLPYDSSLYNVRMFAVNKPVHKSACTYKTYLRKIKGKKGLAYPVFKLRLLKENIQTVRAFKLLRQFLGIKYRSSEIRHSAFFFRQGVKSLGDSVYQWYFFGCQANLFDFFGCHTRLSLFSTKP